MTGIGFHQQRLADLAVFEHAGHECARRADGGRGDGRRIVERAVEYQAARRSTVGLASANAARAQAQAMALTMLLFICFPLFAWREFSISMSINQGGITRQQYVCLWQLACANIRITASTSGTTSCSTASSALSWNSADSSTKAATGEYRYNFRWNPSRKSRHVKDVMELISTGVVYLLMPLREGNRGP